jgi:hypothetical protein
MKSRRSGNRVAGTLAILALAGLIGTGAVFADSNAAQMTVGVTVVRSCVVDVRAGDMSAPQLRLNCTASGQSTVKVTESIPQPSVAAGQGSDAILTLNF